MLRCPQRNPHIKGTKLRIEVWDADLGWAGVAIYLANVAYGVNLLLYAFFSFELHSMPAAATNAVVGAGGILTVCHMLYKYHLRYTHDE